MVCGHDRDEIGLLASLFNNLVDELEGAYETMSERSRSLQDQIAEREEAESTLLETCQQLELALAERNSQLERISGDRPAEPEEHPGPRIGGRAGGVRRATARRTGGGRRGLTGPRARIRITSVRLLSKT